MSYIFERPECLNKEIASFIDLPIRSIENRRAVLIRKGFPIESPLQLEAVDCQPRRRPVTRAERVYLICEILNADTPFTLEQTARYSGLDINLIQEVQEKLEHYDEATCDEESVRFYNDRVKSTLAAIKRNKKKTPHQIAKLVRVPLSTVYAVMRRFSVTCATDKEAYIRALQVDNPLEWRRSCVKRDHQYLEEVKKFGYDGVRLPPEEWARYREIYELKKLGKNWTESGPVTTPKPPSYGRTAVPIHIR